MRERETQKAQAENETIEEVSNPSGVNGLTTEPLGDNSSKALPGVKTIAESEEYPYNF